MGRARRSFITLAALALVAHEASAQSPPAVSVALQLRNVAGVPDAIFQDARERVLQIFGRAQITLESESDRDFTSDPPLTLVILITDKRPPSRKVFESGVLGLAAESAQGRGRVAWVFYDRALRYARTQSVPVSVVLAFVIAHELGHLLLPAPAHAKAGIMKDSWTLADIGEARTRGLGFQPEQSDAMRQYLLSISVPYAAGELSY
jgi:hypothetical protein